MAAAIELNAKERNNGVIGIQNAKIITQLSNTLVRSYS